MDVLLRILLVVVALASAACPDPLCAEVTELTTIEIEVGTGLEQFEPIEPSGELLLHEGFQGGHHVYAAVRGHGLASTDPSAARASVHYWAWLGDEVIGEVPSRNRDLDTDADGWSIEFGEAVQLEVCNPPGLEGQTVEIEAEVTDRCGTSDSDRRGGTLRIAPPE